MGISNGKAVILFSGYVTFFLFLPLLCGPWVHAMTPDDIPTMESVFLKDLSPDGRSLIYEHILPAGNGLMRSSTIYHRDLESGHDLVLFSPDDDGMAPVFSPDGKSIGYLRAGGPGIEFWTMDTDGGNRQFKGKVSRGVDSFQWAPDGQAIAWIAPVQSFGSVGLASDVEIIDHIGFRHLKPGDREGKLDHIFSLDLTRNFVHQVTRGHFDVGSFSWSPESERLVYAAKSLDDLGLNLNTDLWVVSINGSDATRITKNPGGDEDPQWLPDGRIAWLRREDPIWESAPAVIAVSDDISGDLDKFERHGTGFDNYIYKFGYDDGKFFILGAHSGAIDLVQIHEDTFKILTPGQNCFWSLDIARGKVIMKGSSQLLPTGLFLLDLNSNKRPRLQSLINPHEEWIQKVGLTTPGHFEINVEGRDIEGWYFLPAHMEKNERVPVVLVIHGGPESMHGEYFLPAGHILSTFGYAVLIANPTGSVGYGIDFQKDIKGDWVGRPARELLACLDWAESQGWADPKHMAVMGGSYGGHLAAALTVRSDRFKAAAVRNFVPDMVSFWGTTDEKWFIQWEMGGNPWDEEAKDIYTENSLMSEVGKVQTPTLISSGSLDYRSDASGGLMWFSALKARGVPTRLLRFGDEGHGLRNVSNRVYYYNQLLEWFDEHLLNTRQ
jgi:dipeptidyl aminopeptidase/acylaminoacyl peptidase